MKAIIFFFFPCTKPTSSSSSSSSPKSPAFVDPFFTDRVVISNSRERPHAGSMRERAQISKRVEAQDDENKGIEAGRWFTRFSYSGHLVRKWLKVRWIDVEANGEARGTGEAR